MGDDRVRQCPPLPIELVPLILDAAWRLNQLSTLARASQVSSVWAQFAQPLLWRRIWLRDQNRVKAIFKTLAGNLELCKFVRVLELRVYPLGLGAEQLEELEEAVSASLRSLSNLEELVWTRTGSLNGRIIPDLIANKQRLHTLELTGNTRHYDAAALYRGVQRHRPPDCVAEATPATGEEQRHLLSGGQTPKTPKDVQAQHSLVPFPALRSVSFILPDTNAVHAVIELAKRVKLRSVNLLCQHTSVFQPAHAQVLSAELDELERLVLVGCKRIDGDSVKSMIAASKSGIRVLALEACGVVSQPPQSRKMAD